MSKWLCLLKKSILKESELDKAETWADNDTQKGRGTVKEHKLILLVRGSS